MRKSLPEMLQALSVHHEMMNSDIEAWMHYDEEKKATCSAQVRMGEEGEEIQAEVQFIYEEPEPGQLPVEQIIWLRAFPHADQKWTLSHLRIQGEDKTNSVYDWETKGCRVFSAVITKLNIQKWPDLEAILKREFHDRERYGGAQGGASKAPIIKPAQLLDMKQGRGF